MIDVVICRHDGSVISQLSHPNSEMSRTKVIWREDGEDHSAYFLPVLTDPEGVTLLWPET